MHARKLYRSVRTAATHATAGSSQRWSCRFARVPRLELRHTAESTFHSSTAHSWRQGAFRAAGPTIKAQMQVRQRHNHPSPAVGAQPQTPGRGKICWRCQLESARTALLCDNERCRAIQPVGKGVTYFDLFSDDGQLSFDVDTVGLRRRFLKLQQTVHPDSFSQKEDMERKLAEAQSSWINHAYATLKDPLRRARYLLKLQGREIDEKDQITDPELLMEIMESREEIEMAKTESQVADIRRRNELKVAGVVDGLSQAFARGDLVRARDLTHHLQYLRRISQTVHSWEPSSA
ncbi:molecular chaperone [Coemansia pectinata]|uniref:Molecular chaperone n=1 Tax=Coemansia pectinata TaxID=1052879 RepID=A0A9W8GY34_9FUNG|nr:molecular chaperone [Coemansia pectinata]